MNLADHLMALTTNREMLPNPYRNLSHSSNASINSSSSFSDDSPPESAFVDKTKEAHNAESLNKLNHELATIFAANSLLSVDETPKKKNIYVQQRVKHSSGGSTNTNGGKKVATAWKRITDKFGRPQFKSVRHPKTPNPDAWRRLSVDTAPGNVQKLNEEGKQRHGGQRRPDLARVASLETDEDFPEQDFRPRSSSTSVISHFKIVSKNAETADFTVTEPSKLADASALCKEYFSRLTCYDAIPYFTAVIAVDKMVPISKVFNAFCDNDITAIMLWDSVINSMVSACHVDDLVCRLWAKARRYGCDGLFDVESDFWQPLVEFCSVPFMKSVPVDTSVMDAARLLCAMTDDCHCQSSKRLALVQSRNDIVHLMSAWDILHFFSEQVSKFHAAHTAFDRTLGSILAEQPESRREVEILPASKPLKEVIGSLAAKGGGAVVSRFGHISGKEAIATLSFIDIIQYVVYSQGSWNEADETDSTLGHVLKYTQKESLVFTANTPLFAVLIDWVPSMTADMPVVVVSDCSSQNVLGVLEPEHLLQALLFDAAQADADGKTMSATGDIPVSTRL